MTLSKRDNRSNIGYRDTYTLVYADEGKRRGDVCVRYTYFSFFFFRENKQRYDKHTHINLKLITVSGVRMYTSFLIRETYKAVLIMTTTLAEKNTSFIFMYKIKQYLKQLYRYLHIKRRIK
jgi:hypothetical protein